MAFSPDFEIMVTGSDDQRVRVFNAHEGTLVCKLKGHTGNIYYTWDLRLMSTHAHILQMFKNFEHFSLSVLK